jgi:hypothetical protein
LDGWLLQSRYHKGEANNVYDLAVNVRFEPDMASMDFKDTHNALKNDLQIFKKEPLFRRSLFRKMPLANNSGITSIERAMEINPDMLATFVSAGLDKVIHWQKVKPEVDRLLSLYPDRLSWDMWPSDSHAMGIDAQTPRYAACIKKIADLVANR